MAESTRVLAIEYEEFNNLILAIRRAFGKDLTRLNLHIGAVLNCLLSLNATEKVLFIDQKLVSSHAKVKTEFQIPDSTDSFIVKVPIIYNESTIYSDKAFYLLSENNGTALSNYSDVLIHNINFDPDFSYYQIKDSQKLNSYSDLSDVEKKELMKEANAIIDEVDKNDIIAGFYFSLYKLLQLSPNTIFYYILCLELLFCVLGIGTNAINVTDDLIEIAKRKSYKPDSKLPENGELNVMVGNIYISVIQNLSQLIKSELDEILADKELR